MSKNQRGIVEKNSSTMCRSSERSRTHAIAMPVQCSCHRATEVADKSKSDNCVFQSGNGCSCQLPPMYCPNCSQLLAILFSIVTLDCRLIQAQQCCIMLLIIRNNVGGATLHAQACSESKFNSNEANVLL